jgi:hypothetical protein
MVCSAIGVESGKLASEELARGGEKPRRDGRWSPSAIGGPSTLPDLVANCKQIFEREQCALFVWKVPVCALHFLAAAKLKLKKFNFHYENCAAPRHRVFGNDLGMIKNRIDNGGR